jgi:hypothetical protein
MENRLALCSGHLLEVEAKLRELEESSETQSEERARLVEALAFVQEAITAVSETQKKIENLPNSVRSIESGPNRSKSAGAA